MKRSTKGLIFKALAIVALAAIGSVPAVAQTTIFTDNFSSYSSGTTTSGNTFGSGTWLVTASGTATGGSGTSDGGVITNGSLATLTNDATATGNTPGRVSMSTSLSGLPGYNTTLDSNSGLLTWTWNMRFNRTAAPSGFANTQYGNAFVLASNTSSFGISAATGYAVLYGNNSSPDTFRLVAFNGGLISDYTTAGSAAGNALITGTGAFATTTQAQANSYYSFKVTYDTPSKVWTFFGRDDGTTAFSDPATGSFTTIGSFTESSAIYRTTALNFMGGLWSYSTAGNQTSSLDNITLTLTAATAKNLAWNTTDGTWNTSATNWLDGATPAAFAQGDNVTFAGTGGGTITLSGSLAPASMTVSAAAGTYTFSGATASDKISGLTSIAKSGAGTAVFTSANDFSGGVSVTGGIVSISGSDQLGSGAITVNGGQLTSTAGSALTLANAFTTGSAGGTVDTGAQNLTINGATNLNGLLTKSGDGTLSLGAVTTGAGGGVSVAAGNLALTSGVVNLVANSSLTGNLVLNGATRLNVNNGATLSGAGQVQLAATGAALSNLTGTTGGTISAPIALNSTGIVVTPGSWSGVTYTPSSFVAAIAATTTATMTVSGTISGNADLVLANNTTTGGAGGMLVLAAANTYTGNTLFNTSSPGVGVPSNLRLGVDNALPTTGGVIAGTLANLGAAVLDMNGRNQQVAYLADGANVSGTAKNLTIRNFGASDSTLTIGGSVTPGTAFSGVIGTGSTNKINLVKAGSNTQTLTGVNTYTGDTTISGGTLALSGAGSIASSPSIAVGTGATFDVSAVTGGFTLASGQTLSGVGTVAGGVTLGNGSTIAPATAATAGTLTTGNLTLSGGASYAVNFVNATTGAGIGWDLIDSTGTVTLPGSAFTVALSGAGTGFNSSADASWRILAATALGGTFDAANFSIADTTGLNLAGGSFSVSDSGDAGTGLYLVFTAGQSLSWIGGSGAWAATGGTDWSGGGWNPAKTAIFGTPTAGTVTVAAGGVNADRGMQFDTTGYTVAGDAVTLGGTSAAANTITTGSGVTATVNAVLAGSNGFTKAGAGTLDLGGGNTVAGTINVSAGTLRTTVADGLASTANVTVGSGATFALGGNDTIGTLAGAGGVDLGGSTLSVGATGGSTTFSGVASGSGGLTKTGTGTFTLSGANTYSGATTVDAGTLATSAADRIADTSAVVVGSGATFQVGGAETIGSLAGSGAVTLGSFTLTTGNDGTSTTYSGAAGGTGGLTKIGAGTFTLSGANTYSGATTINAGTLATAANDVIADTSAVSVATGATFQVGGNDTIAALSGLGTATVGAGSTLTVSPAATGTFAGTLAGAGTFAKAGAATLALNGTANTITNLTVSAGALSLGATGALPTSGAVAVNDAAKVTLAVGGTFGGSGQTVTLAANQSAAAIIDIASGSSVTLLSNVSLAGSAANRIEANGATGSLTLAGNVTGAGTLLKAASGNLVLAGSNSGSWGTQVGNGTLTVNAGSGLGSGDLLMNQTATNNTTLALNESVTVGNLSSAYSGTGNNAITVAAGKTLTVTQTVGGTFGAAQAGTGRTSTIGGAGGFTKTGSATLTLAGANSFTGTTTVAAGTLATSAANAISGDATVAGGATLSLGGGQTFTSLSAAGTVAAGASAVTVNNASASTVATLTGDAAASLSKDGAGSLTITDGSGFGGSVTIAGGDVTAGSLGSGAVTMTAGRLFGSAGATIGNAITIGSLNSTPVIYSQNFDSIAGGLPLGWSVSANATGSSLGTAATFTQAASPWSTSGAFFNAASANGAGITSASDTAAQAASPDRAVAVRPTGSFADPGASFIYRFSTTGTTISSISFDMEQLSAQPRSTTWSIQYGLGASPTSFTEIGTYADPGVWGSQTLSFGTAAFGTALDNQADVVFRVVALVSSTGAGNRDTTGIDNFQIRTSLGPTGAGTLGINEAGGVTYSGNILNNNLATLTAVAGGTATFSGAVSGSGSITKTGAGTVILAGANTYVGTTAVNAGGLLVNGDNAGTGLVSVAGGAWIGGTGSLAGGLTLASGAGLVFDPLSTLDVSGAVTLDSGFGVASLLTADGSSIDWNSIADGTYTLIGLTTSTFDGIQNFGESNAASIGGVRTAYFQNGSLQLVVVPEPSTFALAGLGMAAAGIAAWRRRRAG